MKKFDKIYVEITNICNLNCKFCEKGNRELQFMNIEDFQFIINIIKNYTKIIALHVKGEPLLHPNLKKILEICNDNNIFVNITTNTTYLKKNIEILAKSPALRQLNLSLHSLMQNDLNVKDNVFNIFENVDMIRELNKHIIFSYRLWNITSIEENYINSEILNLLGNKYHITNIEYRSKGEKFIKLEENVYLNQDREFEWPSLEKDIICQTGKCYGLKKHIGILVNGDVIPCCLDQNGDIKLGNIFEKSLNEILNTNRAQKIVKGFNEGKLIEELCKRCGFINTKFK